MRSREQIFEIEIVEYSKKGNGVGYFERQDNTRWPVEVSYTIPGDKVRVTVLRKRSGVYQSRLEEIVKPSTERIFPRCVHFGICGGCRWQQISYKKQLENKEAFVRKQFAKLLTSEVEFHNILFF